MKIQGNQIRIGMVLFHNNKLYKVTKSQHVKPGKGVAYAQTELKDIRTGAKVHERFRSEENVERAVLEQKDCIFSYHEQTYYVFMDQNTYEQIEIGHNLVTNEQKPFIEDGIVVEIEFYENEPIGLTLPKTIKAEVVETEVAIKGQTASSSFKPAILSNKIRVMVPTHIEVGAKILVNTEDLTYIGKAN